MENKSNNDLKDLIIKDLCNQRKNGQPLQVWDKYFYLTKDQATKLGQLEEGVDIVLGKAQIPLLHKAYNIVPKSPTLK